MGENRPNKGFKMPLKSLIFTGLGTMHKKIIKNT